MTPEVSWPQGPARIPFRPDKRASLPPIQILANLTFWVAAIVALSGFLPPAIGAEPETKSFTDSRGRTAMYRYSLMDEWDPTEPRGLLMYFHGKNDGSQADLLDAFFPWLQSVAWERGLIPLMPASPEARGDFNIEGDTRDWIDEDMQFIHELLQSGVASSFAVDHERIVFAGGSKGTCFLNDFIRAYGESYGGGLLARCGCFNYRERTWVPTQAFRDRFKVIVQDTTEDFLYESSLSAYAYYKYTLDFQTRGDLEATGATARWEIPPTIKQSIGSWATSICPSALLSRIGTGCLLWTISRASLLTQTALCGLPASPLGLSTRRCGGVLMTGEPGRSYPGSNWTRWILTHWTRGCS